MLYQLRYLTRWWGSKGYVFLFENQPCTIIQNWPSISKCWDLVPPSLSLCASPFCNPGSALDSTPCYQSPTRKHTFHVAWDIKPQVLMLNMSVAVTQRWCGFYLYIRVSNKRHGKLTRLKNGCYDDKHPEMSFHLTGHSIWHVIILRKHDSM